MEAVRSVSSIPAYAANLLVIKFAPKASASARREALLRAGVTVARRVEAIGLVVVRVAPSRRAAALALLQASSAVARAGMDPIVSALDTIPNDSSWASQWALRQVHLPGAWDSTRGSSSVIVADVDTGVDAAHPDLAGATLPGYDLINSDSDPADDQGHGTGVAGVIAARTNNRQGVAGVCWGCSILPIKVLDSGGHGDLATVAAGIVRAVDAGAHVINLSLGGPASDPALNDAVAYATRNNVIVVAAAGNNGSDAKLYPAATPGVVSVAATDERDKLYPWSNYGSWVAVAAPGCDLTALRGGQYGTYCGTSFAAPLVSGLLGLARSFRPTATPAQLVSALEQSTTAIGAAIGRGRIDAAAALAALPSESAPLPAPTRPTMKTLKGSLTSSRKPWNSTLAIGGDRAEATIRWNNSEKLTATLTDSTGLRVRQTGGSPLQVGGAFAAGKLTLSIVGPPAKQTFAVQMIYSRAVGTAEEPVTPNEPAVHLSPVPQIPAGLPGPQLGAPPSTDAVRALGFSLTDHAGLSSSLLPAINQLRRSHGLPAITASPALARAAQAHARALAASGQFSHDWSDGTPFTTWIRRYFPQPKAGTWLAGENLVWSSSPMNARQAVAAWLASPPHRNILLDPTWREFGTGAVTAVGAQGVYGDTHALIIAADFGATSQRP